MRRLTQISIDGLLGRFRHVVEIDPTWEFVVLHGPNGVGKTKLLEAIASSLGARPDRLFSLPFTHLRLHFSDGAVLEVTKQYPSQLVDTEDSDPSPGNVEIALHGTGQDVSWLYDRPSLRAQQRAVRDIERNVPLERIGPETWYDLQWSEALELPELLARYGDALEAPVEGSSMPAALSDFMDGVGIHLIETQRLHTLSDVPRRGPRRTASRRPTVQEFADDLTRQISRALAQNSRLSQELDKSFPRRVLDAADSPALDLEQIQTEFGRQSHLRQQLAEIAVLDASEQVPLPDRELTDWERGVLSLSLEDSAKKLATFQTILSRVELLKEVVDRRFLFKSLRIDAERGFYFVADDTDAELPPSTLSSGEQHEIVLLYDLLFKVGSGSVVLIDEPEISLHVAWQQEVLNDLKRISEIANLQFIVATHSPQIMNGWWDREVALYERELRPNA